MRTDHLLAVASVSLLACHTNKGSYERVFARHDKGFVALRAIDTDFEKIVAKGASGDFAAQVDALYETSKKCDELDRALGDLLGVMDTPDLIETPTAYRQVERLDVAAREYRKGRECLMRMGPPESCTLACIEKWPHVRDAFRDLLAAADKVGATPPARSR